MIGKGHVGISFLYSDYFSPPISLGNGASAGEWRAAWYNLIGWERKESQANEWWLGFVRMTKEKRDPNFALYLAAGGTLTSIATRSTPVEHAARRKVHIIRFRVYEKIVFLGDIKVAGCRSKPRYKFRYSLGDKTRSSFVCSHWSAYSERASVGTMSKVTTISYAKIIRIDGGGRWDWNVIIA